MVKTNLILYCYTDTVNEIKLNNTLMPMEQTCLWNLNVFIK